MNSSDHSINGRPRSGSRPLSRPPSRDASPPARIATVSFGVVIAISALAALRAADHLLTPLLLAFRELVALARERVFFLAEIDANRRAFHLEALAEEILEIAPIAVRDVLGARAV